MVEIRFDVLYFCRDACLFSCCLGIEHWVSTREYNLILDIEHLYKTPNHGVKNFSRTKRGLFRIYLGGSGYKGLSYTKSLISVDLIPAFTF